MYKYLLLVAFYCALTSCKSYSYVSDTHIENERLAESGSGEDSKILTMIAPYRQLLDQEMNEVIGTLDHEMTKKRPESTIGNWLSDMLQEELTQVHRLSIDFSIQNHGGVRISSVAPGDITVGKVYEIMPFDNKLAIITCQGSMIKTLLDHIAKDGGWPISKELRFNINNESADSIHIGGQPLDLNRDYSFALPDYIANGGSGSSFLRGLDRVDLDVYIRDVFLDHLRREGKEGKTQSSVLDQRLKVIDHE